MCISSLRNRISYGQSYLDNYLATTTKKPAASSDFSVLGDGSPHALLLVDPRGSTPATDSQSLRGDKLGHNGSWSMCTTHIRTYIYIYIVYQCLSYIYKIYIYSIFTYIYIYTIYIYIMYILCINIYIIIYILYIYIYWYPSACCLLPICVSNLAISFSPKDLGGFYAERGTGAVLCDWKWPWMVDLSMENHGKMLMFNSHVKLPEVFFLTSLIFIVDKSRISRSDCRILVW